MQNVEMHMCGGCFPPELNIPTESRHYYWTMRRFNGPTGLQTFRELLNETRLHQMGRCMDYPGCVNPQPNCMQYGAILDWRAQRLAAQNFMGKERAA